MVHPGWSFILLKSCHSRREDMIHFGMYGELGCQSTLFWTVHHDLLSPAEGSRKQDVQDGRRVDGKFGCSKVWFLLTDFKMCWHIQNSISKYPLLDSRSETNSSKASILNTIVEVDTPEIPRENQTILVFTLIEASVVSTTSGSREPRWRDEDILKNP